MSARTLSEHTLDSSENSVHNGVTTMFLAPDAATKAPRPVPKRYHYVRAPPGIDGVRPGGKLRVLQQFVSDASCPFGPGLTCLKLEARLLAVFTPNGIAWLQC